MFRCGKTMLRGLYSKAPVQKESRGFVSCEAGGDDKHSIKMNSHLFLSVENLYFESPVSAGGYLVQTEHRSKCP